MTAIAVPAPRTNGAHLNGQEPDNLADLRVRQFADDAAEQVVLGMMMCSPQAIEDAADVLAAADLYRSKHELIWYALMALWAGGNPTDPIAVARTLDEAGDLPKIGGLPYLYALVERVPTAVGTVTYHAKIVHDWARRRRAHGAGLRVVQSATNLTMPVDSVVEDAQRAIHEATVSRHAGNSLAVADFIDDEFAHLEDVRDGKVEPGISSGFKGLDRILGGWQPGRLVIPAGRPGAGKSLLSLNWARHAVKLGYPVLIFPMEMSKREVMWRLWADWARVPLHLFQNASFHADDWNRLRVARDEIRKLPLVVDDQVNTVTQVRSTSRRFAQRYGRPGLVIADYVQRFNFPGKDRHDIEVGNAAKALKELARELETTVVAVCQINRGNESRADKLPQLSDLRDSGQLEQEADQVILIHRPDYYDKEHARAGEADLIVAKNRHGPTDTVTVAAQLHFARFKDMAVV